MSTTEDLRRQVRAAVIASGLKQVWIADQLGITPKHLSQMLTGRATLTLHWADLITGLTNDTVHIAVGASEITDEYTRKVNAAQAEATALRRTIAVIRAYADQTLYSGPAKVDACEVREKLLWLTADSTPVTPEESTTP